MDYRWLVLVLAALVGLLALGYARADERGVKAGDQAPPFSLAGSDGRRHTLADLGDRAVVIAWFPKAFTSG